MESNDLVIVGNGFDLNHGLDTSYRSFYNSLPKDLKDKWKNYMEKYEIPHETWSNFEDIIGNVTRECFYRYINTYVNDKTERERNDDTSQYKKELDDINKVFIGIYHHFWNFISSINTGTCDLNSKVSIFIKKDTPVFSFNYTNLIRRYSDNVYYIHGSINEKFIVFGYSQRAEPDYIDLNAAIFDKQKDREILSYIRFLKRNFNILDSQIEKFAEEYRPLVMQSFTALGGWGLKYPEEFKKKCEKYDTGHFSDYPESLQKEAKKYRLEQISVELNTYLEEKVLENKSYGLHIDTNFNWSKINRLLVMGHGLEADLEIFDSLLQNLHNISEVILFVYKGEKCQEIKRKKGILEKLLFRNGENIKITIEDY